MNLMMICLEALERIISTRANSEEVINDYFKKFELTYKESAFFKHTIINIICKIYYLEYLLIPYLDKKRYRSWVRPLLYLFIYRIYFLGENKDEVVSETIDICEIKDSKFASSFRTILQNFLDMPLRSLEGLDEINYLSIKYSYPAWLVAFLRKDYLLEDVESILKLEYNEKLRNDAFLEVLNFIEVKDNLKVLDLFSSTNPILFKLASKNHNILLDGIDPILENVEELTNTAKAKGLNIHYHHLNPLDVGEIFTPNSFDIIIANMPSSGLGALHQYIDYKYDLNLSSIEKITSYQQQVLNSTCHLTKSGGYYIYITNTLNSDENEKQILSYLKTNIEYRSVFNKKVMPSSDKIGYFICVLKRL